MEDWKIKRHEFARYVALEKQNMAVIEAAKAMNEVAKAIERGEDVEDSACIAAIEQVREAVEALEATEAPDRPPDAT